MQNLNYDTGDTANFLFFLLKVFFSSCNRNSGSTWTPVSGSCSGSWPRVAVERANPRTLESETPARGLAADKHVYAGAGVHTEQDGTRETFCTLPVDFGFRSFFPSHRLAMWPSSWATVAVTPQAPPSLWSCLTTCLSPSQRLQPLVRERTTSSQPRLPKERLTTPTYGLEILLATLIV